MDSLHLHKFQTGFPNFLRAKIALFRCFGTFWIIIFQPVVITQQATKRETYLSYGYGSQIRKNEFFSLLLKIGLFSFLHLLGNYYPALKANYPGGFMKGIFLILSLLGNYYPGLKANYPGGTKLEKYRS